MPDTSDTSLHDNDPVIATVALKQLVCCGSDQTVRDAAILMRRHSISSVLIVAPDNGRVCGIWTAADTRKLDFGNPGTADTLLLNVIRRWQLDSINNTVSHW